MPLDNQQELFYWVDEQDNVLGSIPRSVAHSDPTKIHRAVSIFVKNKKNQMLFQQRSLQKDTCPGHWDLSCSGHVTFGQTYDEAAERELLEEIGFAGKPIYIDKFLFNVETEMEYVALYELYVDEVSFSPDPTEVQQLEWVNIDQIPLIVKDRPFGTFASQILRKMKYA